MALLSKAIKDKEYDVRTIDRSLAKGLMTRDQVQKNEKTLADDADNGDMLNVEELYEGIKGKSPLRGTSAH